MKEYLWGALALIILVAGGWYVATRPAASGTALTHTALYSCAAGKTIEATFTDGPVLEPQKAGQPPIPTGTVQLVLSDESTLNLKQTISADGVRYANPDESFVFWTKGNGAVVLQNNVSKDYTGCILVAPQPAGSTLGQIFSDGTVGFSIRAPDGYHVNDQFSSTVVPGKEIHGVQFSVPDTRVTGTNLGSDSGFRVEVAPQAATCAAALFLDTDATFSDQVIDGVDYSFGSSVGAGAGNRYEDVVYALKGTNPCIAFHTFIHYGVLENYTPGAVKAFDRATLLADFIAARKTLIINQ